MKKIVFFGFVLSFCTPEGETPFIRSDYIVSKMDFQKLQNACQDISEEKQKEKCDDIINSAVGSEKLESAIASNLGSIVGASWRSVEDNYILPMSDTKKKSFDKFIDSFQAQGSIDNKLSFLEKTAKECEVSVQNIVLDSVESSNQDQIIQLGEKALLCGAQASFFYDSLKEKVKNDQISNDRFQKNYEDILTTVLLAQNQVLVLEKR